MNRETMEISRQDNQMWCRPINAPRSVPWRPVSGESKARSESWAEASRVLRREGYRVTRRRSGL